LLAKLLMGMVGIILAGCGKSEQGEISHRHAPPLPEGLTWVNRAPTDGSEFRGKVTALFFFDTSSARSIQWFPCLKAWQARYAAHSFAVIGIVSAEYDFSLDPMLVSGAVRRHQLTFPVATDGEYAVSRAYQVQTVPRLFIVDSQGVLRYDGTGDRNCASAERIIQQLLREHHPTLQFPPVFGAEKEEAVFYPVTAPLFLGRVHGQPVNCDPSDTNTIVSLTLPSEREEGKVYAVGRWSLFSSSLRHAEDSEEMDDCLTVKYRGVGVDVVMRPEGGYWKEVFVQLNGRWLTREVAGTDIVFDEKGRSVVEVKSPRLYNLITGQPYGVHELRLISQGKGLSVYSFSFRSTEIPGTGPVWESRKP